MRFTKKNVQKLTLLWFTLWLLNTLIFCRSKRTRIRKNFNLSLFIQSFILTFLPNYSSRVEQTPQWNSSHAQKHLNFFNSAPQVHFKDGFTSFPWRYFFPLLQPCAQKLIIVITIHSLTTIACTVPWISVVTNEGDELFIPNSNLPKERSKKFQLELLHNASLRELLLSEHRAHYSLLREAKTAKQQLREWLTIRKRIFFAFPLVIWMNGFVNEGVVQR